MADQAGLPLDSRNQPASPRPLAELLYLAAPTVAQMASYTLMQFIDTWILAHAGGSVLPPTAAANAGMLAFAAISMGMGVMFIVNTLVSQSFGRKDPASCGRFLWQGIWFAVGFAILLLPLIPFAPGVFRSFGHEAPLAKLEGTYLRIVLAASVLKLAATAIEQFFLGVNRPMTVAVATMTGVGVNAVVAWIIVMGRLGFHPMGVAGAAMAQNIGVGVELGVMVLFTLIGPVKREFHRGDWRLRTNEMLTLLKVGIPSGFQIIADVLAWSAFTMWVMAVFHTTAMAANIFVFRYMSVSFMPAFGISVAVTALVGRYIGMGRTDIAIRRAHLGFVVTAVYMAACGAALFIFRRQLIGLFTSDPRVLAIGARLLIFAAIYQLFDAMYIVYNGALRGAGDTLIPAVATGVLCWGVTVLGGYTVARLWPEFGPAGPWTAATTYGAILGIFMVRRFTHGGWKRIHLEREASQSLKDSAKLSVVSGPLSVVKGSAPHHGQRATDK
jgi:MATE family multidrug resistance protein